MLECKCAECLQVFYAFSGREVVQDLASQPEFFENMCRYRDNSAAGYFGSTDAKRIDQATNGKLLGTGSLTFSAFLDWGSLYKTAHHSTGILCIRWGSSLLAIVSTCHSACASLGTARLSGNCQCPAKGAHMHSSMPPCRCSDLPGHLRSKHNLMAILGVLCGPNEPAVLDAFVGQVLSVFKDHGPEGEH